MFALSPIRYFGFSFPTSHKASISLGLRPIRLQSRTDSGASEIHVLTQVAAQLIERENIPEELRGSVSAGQLWALSTIEEVLRYLLDSYCFEAFPGTLPQALSTAASHPDCPHPERVLGAFVELFPSVEIEDALVDPKTYLSQADAGRPHRLVAVREIILLSLTVSNPAASAFLSLYEDSELQSRANYQKFIQAMETFFTDQPRVPSLGMNLFDSLRAPMKASPNSLSGQIQFILDHWASVLPESVRKRLLLSKDLLSEENRPRGFGPGPNLVLEFGPGKQTSSGGLGDYPEFERFSEDKDWMSNVVMIAKSTYVWLDQLSKEYKRPINRLDQIPEEELARLGKWGFTSLWLIGVWERSKSSQTIKQVRGNPEAVASAYSLADYDIAADLGGEAAYQVLKDRAARHGVRLASDMVPNHMGIDSRWVVEHPHWFVQINHPPFPTYTYHGLNLSQDSRVSLYIEDGYWDHRDAAVTFKRVDNANGDTTYIYHGNDGTHLPWNDTAQLNYLMPEVREAVIQTILHVARMFPIIRFDAAMTLAKKHYQRLWFPPPGEAGDIPSRAFFAMDREAFDRCMPEEFWREVVDRIAVEAPDTLLLAEAFWLMEGYFVRTLGMHRVYNSAFMNMLKEEENQKYRQTLKNVLEFSPEILKRFVNFMNNPDEKTAVEQFGKGDKYFGVCVLLSTLPGLPMFGHGQIEGYAEKYGMEYRRAYWNEDPDGYLVDRHVREIFPLLRDRHLFSGSEAFHLFDFYVADGSVDENVYAYSNRYGDAKTLVVYNNVYGSTAGWIKDSAAVNTARGGEVQLVRRTLAQVLDAQATRLYSFKDHRSGLTYLRRGDSICDQGLYVELDAYEYHVFLDWSEVIDDGVWGKVEHWLGGRGTASLEEARREYLYAPVIEPLRQLLDRELLLSLATDEPQVDRMEEILTLLREAGRQFDLSIPKAAELIEPLTKAVLTGFALLAPPKGGSRAKAKPLGIPDFLAPLKGDLIPATDALALLAVLAELRTSLKGEVPASESEDWWDRWVLRAPVDSFFLAGGLSEYDTHRARDLVRLLLAHPLSWENSTAESIQAWAESVFHNPVSAAFLNVHEYGGVDWFHMEAFDTFTRWTICLALVQNAAGLSRKKPTRAEREQMLLDTGAMLIESAKAATYQVEPFLELLTPDSV